MAIFSSIIGAVTYAIGWAGGFIGVTTGIGVAAGVQLTTAAAYALASSLISRALQPDISIPRQEIQAVINETDGPRRVYVGENLVGGISALKDTRGGVLYQLIAVADGHVQEFVRYHVDGEIVSRDTTSGYISSGRSSGWIGVNSIASGNGGNYAGLRSAFSYWTTNHRLTNVATYMTYMTAPDPENFSKVFPKASSTLVQAEIKGQRVLDPRNNQTNYSDNAARVILHYLRHADGFGLSDADIDLSSWAEMATVADIPIPQRAGGTAPNLRLWGYWSFDEEPKAVIDRMHGSCGIRPYEMQDGRIGAIGGNFGTPAMTLTTQDIESIKTFSRSQERSGYNVLRPFYISKGLKFTMSETASWRDEDRIAEEGEIVQEYRLEMCPGISQCGRLAKEQIANDNREKIEVITNLVGLKARYPRLNGQRHTIILDYRPADDPDGAIQGEYEVAEHEIDPMDHKCRIVLFKANRQSELWNPEEEGDTSVGLVDFGDDPPPDITAQLSLSMIGETSYIAITVNPIPNRPDLTVQAEYREANSEAWISVPGSGFNLKTPALDAEDYQIRVRFNGIFTGVDEWEVYDFRVPPPPPVPQQFR